MKQCQYIKSNGEKCGAYAVKDDDYCFSHSEKHKQEYSEAIYKGGKSLKRSYIEQPPILLRNQEDIVYLIEQTVNDMRENKISIKMASITAIYVNLAIKAIPLALTEKERIRTSKMMCSGVVDIKHHVEKLGGEIRFRK